MLSSFIHSLLLLSLRDQNKQRRVVVAAIAATAITTTTTTTTTTTAAAAMKLTTDDGYGELVDHGSNIRKGVPSLACRLCRVRPVRWCLLSIALGLGIIAGADRELEAAGF